MSKSTPRVAVITRTKNRPVFLSRAIKSVLDQTYQDFVHVILNDGGDKAAVDEVLSGNPDIRRIVIHNDSSVGLAAALNQAIKASKSDLISIHDDDDAWHPERLEAGLASIDERQAEANVVPMEIVVEDVDPDGEPVEVKRMPHPESWSGEVSLYKQAHRNYLSNGAVMYSRRLYDELGGYDETLPTAEDWDFGIRLMMICDVEQVISDHALVYYHQRPNVKDLEVGNSVHVGVSEQERAIMKLRNRYLRNDLQKGVFGVGFIMNDVEQSLINLVRLEGHVNGAISSIKGDLRSTEETIARDIRKSSLYRLAKERLNKLRQ